MDQHEVNQALKALVDDGDVEPWLRVAEAIREGSVTALYGPATLWIRALPPPARARFSGRIRELFDSSGMTQKQLSEVTMTASTSIIRLLRGQVVPAWGAVAFIIETLGGDPADYLQDYRLARTERKQESKDAEEEA